MSLRIDKRTVILPAKPFEELNKRHQTFCDKYAELGDVHLAYLASGYKENKHSKNRARRLMKELGPYVDERLAKRVQDVGLAVVAVNVIKELAENSDSDAVRLQAAKELLARGGWDAPKEVTVNHTHRNLSNDELDERLRELRQELAETPLLPGEITH